MKKPKVRKVGYWCEPAIPASALPRFEEEVDLDWSQRERAATIDYLATGTLYNANPAVLDCPECGQPFTSDNYTDGLYVWPAAYPHYVAKHGVKPPEKFLLHIKLSIGLESVIVPENPKDVAGLLKVLRPELLHQARLRGLSPSKAYQRITSIAFKLSKRGELNVENLRALWKDPTKDIKLPEPAVVASWLNVAIELQALLQQLPATAFPRVFGQLEQAKTYALTNHKDEAPNRVALVQASCVDALAVYSTTPEIKTSLKNVVKFCKNRVKELTPK